MVRHHSSHTEYSFSGPTGFTGPKFTGYTQEGLQRTVLEPQGHDPTILEPRNLKLPTWIWGSVVTILLMVVSYQFNDNQKSAIEITTLKDKVATLEKNEDSVNGNLIGVKRFEDFRQEMLRETTRISTEHSGLFAHQEQMKADLDHLKTQMQKLISSDVTFFTPKTKKENK